MLALGSLAEIGRVENDMTGRTGHQRFAGSLKGLTGRLGNIEQIVPILAWTSLVALPSALMCFTLDHYPNPLHLPRLIDGGGGFLDVLDFGLRPEADPPISRDLGIAQADRAKDVAGKLAGSAGAGRTKRNSDMAQLRDQQRRVGTFMANVELRDSEDPLTVQPAKLVSAVRQSCPTWTMSFSRCFIAGRATKPAHNMGELVPGQKPIFLA